MDHTPTDGQDVPVPMLARGGQWRIAGAVLALVLVVFWLGPMVWHKLFAPAPPAATAPDDGSFAATDRQWQTLRFATVSAATLGDSAVSDGKIATDDDLTTQVFSPFTGRVTQIFAKAGDHVAAGQPLFAVAANEAAQSDADIATAAAQLKVARAAEARQHDLFDHNGAALKDWQQSQSDLVAAEAALSAAQVRRQALGGAIVHGQGIVRAPVAGIVTQRLIGPGQNVSSASGGGASQAFTISDFSKVWLVGNLREEDASRARVGQMAQVTPLGGGAALQARITYVAPAIDPSTRRLTVRAELPNPNGALKPETYVSFALITGAARQGLSVPEAAVIFEGDTARVWVADMRRHRLMLRPVTTGLNAGGTVEITSGLHAGESVVTEGSLFIDRGAKAD